MTEVNMEYVRWVGLYLLPPVLLLSGILIPELRKHGAELSPYRGKGALGNFGMLLLILAFWPIVFPALFVFCVVDYRPTWRTMPAAPYAPVRKFHCQKGHLLRRVTVEKAEATGKIVDPLHRVPDVPFGHLNAAWQAFLSEKKSGDQLLGFAVPLRADAWWDPRQQSKQQFVMRGYAWVSWGTVKQEFVYEWDS